MPAPKTRRTQFRVGIDLQNVLDVDGSGNRVSSCDPTVLQRVRDLDALGGVITVVSYIGVNNARLREKAGEFVDDMNHRLKRRSTTNPPHVSLHITDCKLGKRGKAQWLEDNGYKYMIDDNNQIIRECRRKGIDALAVETAHEKHPGLDGVFNNVTMALDHIIEDVKGSAPSSSAAAAVATVQRSRKRTAMRLTKDTLERLNQSLQPPRARKRSPWRSSTFLQRAAARRAVEKKFKGTVGIQMARQLPSPCSTCVIRRKKSTRAAASYAAKRWQPKERDADQ